MGIDLGDLLGKAIDVYGSIRRTDARGPTTAFAPTPVAFNQFPISPTPAAGIPFYDVIPEPNGGTGCDPYGGAVWNPRANCGQGKWVKRRKRRKRLASAGDIKDLNALMNVFGNGKALQSWIATH